MAYFFALIFLVIVAAGYFFKKRGSVIFICIVVFVFILHIFSIVNGHSWGDDFIIYLAQAKSLLKGDINAVIAKQQLIQQLSKTKTGPVLYPWGYPVFLAVLSKCFGENYFVFKILNVLAICLTAFVTTLFIETSKKRSLVILFLLIGLNPFLFDFKNEINADILLMFFSTLGMLFIKKIGTGKPFAFLQMIPAALTFFLCTFIKAAGTLVILVFVISTILSAINSKKRLFLTVSLWRNLVAVLAIYAGLIIITNRLLPNFIVDYVNYYNFQSIIKAATHNFGFYILLAKNFVYNSNSVLYFASVLISALLFLLGVILNSRKYFYLNLFSLLFLFTLIITPYTGGLRYLLPLLPVIFLYIFLGGNYLYRHSRKAVSYTGALLTLFLLFCFCVNDFGYNTNQIKAERLSNGAFSPKAKEFYLFLQKNSTARDTLIFFKPRFLSFYLNRVAASYYDTLPVHSPGFSYLTIYHNLNSDKNELKKILPDYLKRKVFDNGDFQIYNLK